MSYAINAENRTTDTPDTIICTIGDGQKMLRTQTIITHIRAIVRKPHIQDKSRLVVDQYIQAERVKHAVAINAFITITVHQVAIAIAINGYVITPST